MPEKIGPQQRGSVEGPRQRDRLSGDRRARVRIQPAHQRRQQPKASAQVKCIFLFFSQTFFHDVKEVKRKIFSSVLLRSFRSISITGKEKRQVTSRICLNTAKIGEGSEPGNEWRKKEKRKSYGSENRRKS